MNGAQRISPERLAIDWRSALDAADAALAAASPLLPAAEVARHAKRILLDREAAAGLLETLAKDDGVSSRFLHLVPVRDAWRVLGLRPDLDACVFNLDGVLVGSASLHAAAWSEVLDPFISARVERTRGEFAPFNPRTDYVGYMHGRPRLDGLRGFLASRGIRLPDGAPDDPPDAETVHGLANRKKEALLRRFDEQGVRAYEGSFHYLETAREAGIHRAVVSASANTASLVERAGLADLIERCVDGNTVAMEHLRPKPAPDTLLAACAELGVEPAHAAAFETTPAGIAAARAGGFALVVGVDDAGGGAALQAEGADVVVCGLAELLERSLAA